MDRQPSFVEPRKSDVGRDATGVEGSISRKNWGKLKKLAASWSKEGASVAPAQVAGTVLEKVLQRTTVSLVVQRKRIDFALRWMKVPWESNIGKDKNMPVLK